MRQNVHPPDAVPCIVGHLGSSGGEYPGVCAEEVHRAESVLRGLEQTHRVVLDRSVGLHCQDGGSNLFGQGVGGGEVDVTHHDPGDTFGGEAPDEGSADPAAATRDHCDGARQLHTI